MQTLQILSIAIEFIIGILAVMSAMKDRKYMYGLALTFFIYVLYDLSKIYSLGISDTFMSILFFVATVSAFVSVWGIYKRS